MPTDLFEALVAACEDPEPNVRAAAVRALGSGATYTRARIRNKDTAAVEAVIGALADREPAVRASAAAALASMSTSSDTPVPDAAVPMLRRLLARDESGAVRVEAASALGWSRTSRETLRALASAVEVNGNYELLWAVTFALVRLGPTREEVPALMVALRDPMSALPARKALAKFGPAVRRRVNVALAPLRTRLEVAIRKGRSSPEFEFDTTISRSETGRLVEALGPLAAPLLPKVLAVWDDLRGPDVADVLPETGREGMKTLIRCLRTGTPKVRAAAASALGAFWRETHAVNALGSALRDPNRKVREAAVEALGRN